MSACGQGAETKFSAPTLITDKGASQRLLYGLVRWWSKRYPLEFRNYKREVDYLKATLSDKGMSVSGDFMQSSVIPTRVAMMAEAIIPDIWQNGGHEIWSREFSSFKIK